MQRCRQANFFSAPTTLTRPCTWSHSDCTVSSISWERERNYKHSHMQPHATHIQPVYYSLAINNCLKSCLWENALCCNELMQLTNRIVLYNWPMPMAGFTEDDINWGTADAFVRSATSMGEAGRSDCDRGTQERRSEALPHRLGKKHWTA